MEKVIFGYCKCPDCNQEFLIDSLELNNIDNKKEVYHKCPNCRNKILVNKNLRKSICEEKEIKLISYQEAVERNIVNPGCVLFSYDKRNWMFADSDPLLWSDSTENHKLYFTTLSFNE